MKTLYYLSLSLLLASCVVPLVKEESSGINEQDLKKAACLGMQKSATGGYVMPEPEQLSFEMRQEYEQCMNEK